MNDMNWIAVYPEMVLLGMTCLIALLDLFSTSPKRGFSRRWLITMAAWAVVWTVAVFTTSRGAIGDNVVWVTVMAIALTAVTAVGAWREAAA